MVNSKDKIVKNKNIPRGTPSVRDKKARERLKSLVSKNVVIYGDKCKRPSTSGKLVFQLAKILQAARHKVFTIGMKYNGVQIMDDGIPIMPDGYCKHCGEEHHSENIENVVNYINLNKADIFICVGNILEIQNFAVGNISFEKMQHMKSILYLTDTKEGFKNELFEEMEKAGKRNPLKYFDKIIVMNKYDQELLREQQGLDSDIIKPGIDLDFYKPATHEQKKQLRIQNNISEEVYLIYACENLSETELINGCKMFMKENENAYVLLNVQDKTEKELETLNKKLGEEIAKRFIIMEAGDIASQKPMYYQMCDVFISTKLSQDIKILEAMACEKVILASKTQFNIEITPDTKVFDAVLHTKINGNDLYDGLKKVSKYHESSGAVVRTYASKFNKDFFGQRWVHTVNDVKKKESNKGFKSMEDVK